MEVIIKPDSVITKKDDGIYVDGNKVLIKDFAIYGLMYVMGYQSKKETEKLYDKMTAEEIFLTVARIYNSK